MSDTQRMTDFRGYVEAVAERFPEDHDIEADIGAARAVFAQIDRAITLGITSAHTDGAHHKQWIIDQMLQLLAGPRYAEITADPNWDKGIAP